MKKILDVVSYNYLPYYSGGQKSVAQFFDFLGNEADLTVASVPSNDFSLAKTYKGLPLLGRSRFRYMDIRLAGKIISLIKKEKYEFVVWEHPYYAWLAWIVKKRTGIKTVFHTHNIEHQRFRSLGKWWWPLLKIYELWSFRFADFIFFITEDERNLAVKKWKINKGKTTTVTFGIPIDRSPGDKAACRQQIAQHHNIAPEERILLFNGVLSYGPNLDAVLAIVNYINPYLLQSNFRYKIIICGKGLPENLNGLKEYREKNIIYTGFVDDIETYFKGADLFLNPVQSGGGIKTKLVEAIGFGTSAISSETGANGVDKDATGNKLVIIPDDSWKQFAQAIIDNKNYDSPTPAVYYQHYYWGNITKKVSNLVFEN
jgi:polysaccharide biosynthesis protein PslH